MKATETQLVKFLQGTKQFIIPIYQRTYSWTEKQCEQLWNDIVRVAHNPDIPVHFRAADNSRNAHARTGPGASRD